MQAIFQNNKHISFEDLLLGTYDINSAKTI